MGAGCDFVDLDSLLNGLLHHGDLALAQVALLAVHEDLRQGLGGSAMHARRSVTRHTFGA